MRIALIAVLALAAVWFVALRPKPDSAASTPAAPPTAPGVAGLTRSIDKARAATAAANASVTKVQSTAAATSGGRATTTTTATTASGTTATKSTTATAPAPTVNSTGGKAAPSPAAAAKPKAIVVAKRHSATAVVKTPAGKTVVVAKPKPKAVAVGPAAPLVAALAHHKVVVLMFGNSSSDSAAVATAVKRLPRRHGKVVIRITNINQVGRYSVFTADTPVTQAPTVLVIGSSRKGRVIVGYTYTGELDQAVADVLASK